MLTITNQPRSVFSANQCRMPCLPNSAWMLSTAERVGGVASQNRCLERCFSWVIIIWNTPAMGYYCNLYHNLSIYIYIYVSVIIICVIYIGCVYYLLAGIHIVCSCQLSDAGVRCPHAVAGHAWLRKAQHVRNHHLRRGPPFGPPNLSQNRRKVCRFSPA